MKVNLQLQEIIEFLNSNKNLHNIESMSRFGIVPDKALGVSIPILRSLAKSYKKQHELALKLWETNIHEARILASIIDDPKQVTTEQMDRWVRDFNSWDICDQCCGNLFGIIPLAWTKIEEWVVDEKEYVRRAAFVLMVCIVVKDKKIDDRYLLPFFNSILKYSQDPRNFVRKAVNWLLRQLGKRSRLLHLKALEVSEVLIMSSNKTAQWIGKDAYKELASPTLVYRLKR